MLCFRFRLYHFHFEYTTLFPVTMEKREENSFNICRSTTQYAHVFLFQQIQNTKLTRKIDEFYLFE